MLTILGRYVFCEVTPWLAEIAGRGRGTGRDLAL
jgi:hypothetical protein